MIGDSAGWSGDAMLEKECGNRLSKQGEHRPCGYLGMCVLRVGVGVVSVLGEFV